MKTNIGIRTENEVIKKASNYGLFRMFVGACIGFIISFSIGYLLACYREGLSLTIGIRIFRHPFLGMGLVSISFIGTIIGALASLYTKKWRTFNKENL